GVHTLIASQPGQQSSSVQILMDRTAPRPGIGAPNPNNLLDPNGPPQSADGWYKDNPHVVSIVPQDPNSFGSGVDTVTYSASGAGRRRREACLASPPRSSALTTTHPYRSRTPRRRGPAPRGARPAGREQTPPSGWRDPTGPGRRAGPARGSMGRPDF